MIRMGRASASKKPTLFLHEYVTGGGLAGGPLPPSLAAEGGAMRRALTEDFRLAFGDGLTMTLDARLPDERGLGTTVRIGPGEELATFARLASESDYTLCLAPETGGILEARARIIESVGGRSLGSSPEAIALCGNKLRLSEHLRALGFDTPETIRVDPRDGLPRDFPYPAVLKPIDGAGSLDTFLVGSPGDLPTSALGMTDAILQPFVPGTPMSASFLVDANGRAQWVGAGRQFVSRSSGRFVYEGGIVPSPMHSGVAIAKAVESVPGLRGWVGVDLILDESTGRISFLEINPRVTTSYVAWRALTGALPHWWLSSLDEDAINGRTGFEGYALRLIPSLDDAGAMPGTGRRLIVVADVEGVIHFRVFDPDGEMVADSDEKRQMEAKSSGEMAAWLGADPEMVENLRAARDLIERLQAGRIASLRTALADAWPPHELTEKQKESINRAVVSLAGCRRFRFRRTDPAIRNPFTPFWRRALGKWLHSRRVARFSADGAVVVEEARS